MWNSKSHANPIPAFEHYVVGGGDFVSEGSEVGR